MGLFNRPKRTYVRIAKGTLQLYNKETATVETFSGFDGTLVGLETKENVINNEPIQELHMAFRDSDGKEYVITCSLYSGVAAGILRSLVRVPDLAKPIRLSVYKNGDFTNTVIYQNSKKVSWGPEAFPQVEDLVVNGKVIMANGRPVKSAEKRNAAIDGLVAQVKDAIGKSDASEPADVADMPAEFGDGDGDAPVF